MKEYVQLLAMLKELSDSMESTAEDAKALLDKVTQIRKRSEDTERLVNECLKMLGV